jgi:hypothetical protein
MSEAHLVSDATRFFDLYSRGDVMPDAIDDFIGRWHDDVDPWARDMPLHEYLGLTHEEYEVWRYDPRSLPCILRSRKLGEDLVGIMTERYDEMLAAKRPEDQTALFSLGNRLKRKQVRSVRCRHAAPPQSACNRQRNGAEWPAPWRATAIR